MYLLIVEYIMFNQVSTNLRDYFMCNRFEIHDVVSVIYKAYQHAKYGYMYVRIASCQKSPAKLGDPS